MNRPALSAYLSRPEWSLCFALSFAHQAFGLVPPDVAFQSLADELRYAVAHLAEQGFAFEALRVAPDGRILPTVETPICAENLASCALIVYGLAPDYPSHFEAAIALLDERAPHLRRDLDALAQARREIEETIEQPREEIPT